MHGLIEIYGSRNSLHFLNHGTGKMLAMCLYFITEENAEMVNDYSCQKFTVACVWAMNQHIVEASPQGFPFSSVAVSTPGRDPGWSDTPALSLKHSEVLTDRTHRNHLPGDKPHGKQNLRIFGNTQGTSLNQTFSFSQGSKLLLIHLPACCSCLRNNLQIFREVQNLSRVVIVQRVTPFLFTFPPHHLHPHLAHWRSRALLESGLLSCSKIHVSLPHCSDTELPQGKSILSGDGMQ